jgi:hypothetical protein
VALEASRRGNDRDSRHYTIAVSAQDNLGNPGFALTLVTVPHGQGKWTAVAWLDAHCGDVLAELRALLDGDKVRAALAGVGAEAVLARLHREFFQGWARARVAHRPEKLHENHGVFRVHPAHVEPPYHMWSRTLRLYAMASSQYPSKTITSHHCMGLSLPEDHTIATGGSSQRPSTPVVGKMQTVDDVLWTRGPEKNPAQPVGMINND